MKGCVARLEGWQCPIRREFVVPDQIRVWAHRVYPDAFWQPRFRRYLVLVAEKDSVVVGFVELDRVGEIDYFCVHHAHQHSGRGAAVMARIYREGRSHENTRLRADASVTAETR
jgi:GNAT superfamily N-acetyltransferase